MQEERYARLQEEWEKARILREAKEQARRLSLLALSPLPQRVTPWPWEDLASVISRTAKAMGYASPSWILRPESVEHKIAPDNLPWLNVWGDYQMLSRFLSLDEESLRSLTLYRFESIHNEMSEADGSQEAQDTTEPTAREQSWNIHALFSSFQKTTQVCPCCLAEPKSYDRLYWRATPVLLCPRHRVFLHQSCPVCQRPIPTPRPNLCICPSCGGDYRQQVIPLAPEATWLLKTHVGVLTRLGIDADELGEPPVEEQPTTLQVLPPHDYFWVVTKFLALFEDRLYRADLAPFLTEALPAATLVPGAPQSPSLILHYLLASWPLHWWVLLERFQYIFPSDRLWWGSLDPAGLQWGNLMKEGTCWLQEVGPEQTLVLLHAFFDAVEHAFPFRRTTSKTWKPVVSSEMLLAHHLSSPGKGEMVQPFPWEDLASVISRVARNTRYEDPTWLLISQDFPHRKMYSLDVPLLHRHDDYQLLERQLGLSAETLSQLTLHRFATRLQPPAGEEESASSPLDSSHLHGLPLLNDAACWHYHITLRNTKVCPACLEEAEYDRLFWRFSPLVLCPAHSLLLTEKCPRCRRPIPGLRPASTLCPYCQYDYRGAPRLSIPAPSCFSESQALFFHQLTSEHVGRGEGPAAFADSPLLLLDPWQYFSVWRRFQHILRRSIDRNLVIEVLRQLALAQYPIRSSSGISSFEDEHMTFFHFLFASWPENLLTFLERIPSQPRQPRPVFSNDIDEQFWRFDRLVQSLWHSLARESTSFSFVSQILETLHVWITLSPRPQLAIRPETDED